LEQDVKKSTKEASSKLLSKANVTAKLVKYLELRAF